MNRIKAFLAVSLASAFLAISLPAANADLLPFPSKNPAPSADDGGSQPAPPPATEDKDKGAEKDKSAEKPPKKSKTK